ncbi:MAG TPA: DUF1214 domain-containing protein, partial [Acidimicrobiales bacterium]|nr:DUF1214 domain-containing protein [Acidimicrobiales bacterium]
DGYRYLTRLVVLGLQWMIEFGDPEFPAFYRHDDDVTKWGGPNVDNTYLRARVRGDRAYRIVGNRGIAHGFLISTHEGDMQLEQYGVYDEIWHDQLATDPDGSFELIVGAGRPAGHQGNWLPLHPDSDNITVRIYYQDWSRERPPELRIERIGGEGLAPAPPTPASFAASLEDALDWIEKSTHYWNRYVNRSREEIGENALGLPRSAPGGANDIAYGGGFFDLADDEAFIIEGEPPDAWFWNYMLYNLGWMESLDFANRVTSLNGQQIHIDDDGRYRIVIAHEDPGVPNWLDSTGLSQGMIAFRYVRTATMPAPTHRIVKFDRIRDTLPASTPEVTAATRREQITVRQRHVATRFRR